MQKWEYKLFVIEKHNNRMYFQTAQGIEDSIKHRGPFQGILTKAIAVITNLGSEGWELVSVDDSNHWFKRPISD